MIENNFIKITETLVYKNKLSLEICNLASEFVKQEQDKFIHKSWDCDLRTSKNVTHNILNVEELRNIKFNIMHHIENYMYQTKMFFDGYINQSWVNIYENKYFQEFHNHIDEVYKKISGVVYLTQNNSNIVFGLDNYINVAPEFADIVIFEDHVPHRVQSNEEDLRISIAFNYVKCAQWHGIKETNKEKTND